MCERGIQVIIRVVVSSSRTTGKFTLMWLPIDFLFPRDKQESQKGRIKPRRILKFTLQKELFIPPAKIYLCSIEVRLQ